MTRKLKGSKPYDMVTAIKHITLFILFVSFPVKGFYDEVEALVLYVTISALALLYHLFVKKKTYLEYGELLLLLLAFSYFISFFFAADFRLAFFQIIKQCVYLFVYVLFRHIFVNQKDIKRVLITIFSSISLLTVITLITEGASGAKRFASTLAYANTYALVLVIAVIIGIFMIYEKSRFEQNNSLSCIVFDYFMILNILALVGTKSRGGFLTLILALVLIVIIRRRVIQDILFQLVLYVSSAFAIFFIATMFEYIASVLLLLSIPLAVVMGINYIKRQYRLTARTSKIIGAGAFVVSLFFFISSDLFKRILSIQFSESGIYARACFYYDGLKIFFDNLLIGAGGGGWLALYPRYQGHAYSTLETHSFLIQSMIECGIIGVSLILFLFVVKVVLYIRRRMRDKSTNYEDLAFIGFICITVHSLIDVDLSFPAVYLVLILFLAIMPDCEFRHKKSWLFTVRRGLYVVTYLIIFILISSIGIGKINTFSATKQINMEELTIQEMQQIMETYSGAVYLDPLNHKYYGYLAQIELNLGKSQGDSTLIEKGLLHLDKTLGLRAYDLNTYLVKAQVLDSIGKHVEAKEVYVLATHQAPLKNNAYDFLITHYFEQGIQSSDKQYFEKAIKLVDELRNKMSLIPEERKRIWVGDQLGHSLVQCYYAGQASYYLGEYQKGMAYFKEIVQNKNYDSMQNNLKEEVKGWIVLGEIITQKPLSYNVDDSLIESLKDRIGRK